jgi:tRNA(fMet)-specific endonuclease VapC
MPSGAAHGPPALAERLDRAILNDDFALPTIVLFELQYGIAKSARAQDNAERLATFLELPIPILHFEPDDAQEAGDIRAALERAKIPIRPYDILIAAQARRRGATRLTANLREFARAPRLTTEDWTGRVRPAAIPPPSPPRPPACASAVERIPRPPLGGCRWCGRSPPWSRPSRWRSPTPA